jgi:hypothetical protein
MLDGLTRFGLDFLRINDARYLGLTPAQFLAGGMVVAGIALMVYSGNWFQRTRIQTAA